MSESESVEYEGLTEPSVVTESTESTESTEELTESTEELTEPEPEEPKPEELKPEEPEPEEPKPEKPIESNEPELAESIKKRVHNRLIKMRNVEGDNFESDRKFYLPNGYVMQIATCNTTAIKCACGIRHGRKCSTCYGGVYPVKHKRERDGVLFCTRCINRGEVKKEHTVKLKKQKFRTSLTDEEMDMIQENLDQAEYNEHEIWRIKGDVTMKRVLQTIFIKNEEITKLFTKAGLHFIVPKQITVFEMNC